MKILCVFLDMIRLDHLQLFNPEIKETSLDEFLSSLGGTLYTKCYSPGPDTPRSNACLQTGLLPCFNGCETRIQWPKFFIKDNISTIYDKLAQSGYRVNLCAETNLLDTGLFRYSPSEKIYEYSTPKDFLENGIIEENTFSFIRTGDMHAAINDYHATEKSFKVGFKMIDIFFKQYITRDYINQYDYTIIFSDHGCGVFKESIKKLDPLYLLGNQRSQLLMFLHMRKDKGIKRDERISDITDMYATIADIIGENDFRQGYSFLQKAIPGRIIHIEDHTDFKVYPEQMIKQWRVISETFDISTDINHFLIKKGSVDDLKKCEQRLSEYSSNYLKYKKQLDVWKYYDEIRKDEDAKFFVGVTRISKRKNKIIRLVTGAARYFIRLFQ